MYEYDENFYAYINKGAVESAQRVLPALLNAVNGPIESVLDVGCGAGAWLSVWKSHGAKVHGLDGSYVDKKQLLIDFGEFSATDLQTGFSLGRKFDLVQSLEVAEHLPETAASEFVSSLCRHSDLVLFSAATPGQGGENHINEQDYDYWRSLFMAHGYAMYDPVRQAVAGDPAVKSWYRYNTFLYVGEQCDPAIYSALADFKVGSNERPRDVSPLIYRARKSIIKLLPQSLSTGMAVIKKTLYKLAPK